MPPIQTQWEWYGEVIRTSLEDDDMKRFSILAAAMLLMTACAQSPTGGPTSTSNEPEGLFSLAVGPSVDLILNPGSSTEIPALVADAWKEQQRIDLNQLALTAAAQVKVHNPENIEVTESWLSPIGYGRLVPGETPEAEFATMLQNELLSLGIRYRIVQSELAVDQLIPMSLQDGLTQDMRLTVHEVMLVRDLWIP